MLPLLDTELLMITVEFCFDEEEDEITGRGSSSSTSESKDLVKLIDHFTQKRQASLLVANAKETS